MTGQSDMEVEVNEYMDTALIDAAFDVSSK